MEFKRPVSLKVVYRTLIALENKNNAKIMYDFYLTEMVTNIARSQGMEIKKTYKDLYMDMLDSKVAEEDNETSEQVIEKTCNLFRAFNQKE